jgi:hypothetical protein
VSKKSKILWLISGLCFAGVVTVRYILGGWTTDWLFLPLGISLISLILAIVFDYKFYLELRLYYKYRKCLKMKYQ